MGITSVTFSGAASSAGTAAISSYTWSLDGTGAGSGSTFPHVFQDTATHALALTVTDAANCTSTATTQTQAKSMTGTWQSVDGGAVRLLQLVQNGTALTGNFCISSCDPSAGPVSGTGTVGPDRNVAFNAVSSDLGGIQISTSAADHGGVDAAIASFTGKVIGPARSSAFQQHLTLTFTRQ